MGVLGVRPDVFEKCLNYEEQNKLARIDQRQKFEAEQIKPGNCWEPVLSSCWQKMLRT